MGVNRVNQSQLKLLSYIYRIAYKNTESIKKL